MIESRTSYSESEPKPANRGGWIFLVTILIIVLGIAIALTVKEAGPLSLIAIIGLLLVISTLTNPDLGLMMFIFVIYVNLSSVLITHHGLPSIAKPLVVLMGLLIIIRGALFRDDYRGWVLPAILLGLYSLLGSVSLAYASDFELAQNTLIDYLKDAIIAIIIIMLTQRPTSLRRAIWALLLTGIFMGTLSVYQQLTGSFGNPLGGFAQISSSTTGNRLSGPIGDPNFYAQIMALLVPLAIDRVWNEKKLYLKALGAWAFIVITITVVFTYSRGAFIGLLAGFAYMAIKRPPRMPAALLVLAMLVIGFQFAPITYKERISSLMNIFPNSRTTGYIDQSIQGRTSENLVAWNVFLDNPILGVGLGNYNTYYVEYSKKLGLDARLESRSAHNLYLEIAAERGIFGLLLFTSIILLTYKKVYQAEQKFKELGNKQMTDLAGALSSSVTIYLVTALFLHDAFPRFFWLIVGLAWSIPQSADYLSKLTKLKPANT